MTELSAVKCNGCGTRAFLEDDESPHWGTSVLTCPARQMKITIHYCPGCLDGNLKQIGDPHEKLNTGQRRVINPDERNRELEQALQMDTGVERQHDLDKLGPPDELPPPAPGTAGQYPIPPGPAQDWEPAVAAVENPHQVRMQPTPPPRRRPDRRGRGRLVGRLGGAATTIIAAFLFYSGL